MVGQPQRAVACSSFKATEVILSSYRGAKGGSRTTALQLHATAAEMAEKRQHRMLSEKGQAGRARVYFES